ncbi:MAG: hypoxanthine phosphoribosyltransferase [Bacteroidota bacterium]|nr:hypoxanthine phosphoribosyltransferase [Bacteroidota bacterium]
MKNKIQIKDKEFVTYILHDEILKNIKRVAIQINADYKGKSPIFLAILNGSFFFASDLLKEINLNCEISFVKLASYIGTTTTGQVKELIGINTPLNGRDIIILEDIVDSGKTMKSLLYQIEQHFPSSVKLATLLFKKEALIEDVNPDYVGFTVTNEFLVGYGLDYDQFGRNLKDIYILDEDRK